MTAAAAGLPPRRARVLFTIPHFYRGVADAARHGSESIAARASRRATLDSVIAGIHDLFGERRFAAQHHRKAVTAAPNPLALEFDIAICTTGADHLLDELACPPELFHHVPTDADPKYLGWECHQLLKDSLGNYDFYCYMEDDILLQDPFFFAKIQLFNDYFGDVGGPPPLLQPQRYESAYASGSDRFPAVQRIYMDYQTSDEPSYPGEPLEIEHLGVRFVLEPTSLAHAGCFFLSEAHMRHLVQHPLFLNREAIWVTPLDTAATLAIGTAFAVYKPALDSMAFLEVRHAHPAMIQQLTPLPGGGIDWSF